MITAGLALRLVRSLSRLPGYPYHSEGEEATVNDLVRLAVSEDHAQAIVARFDERFPLPRELADVAWELAREFGGRGEPTLDEQALAWQREARIEIRKLIRRCVPDDDPDLAYHLQAHPKLVAELRREFRAALNVGAR